jgi:transcription antitermination factor NusG
LFCLGFRYDEINRVQGSYLPVEILPFTSDGKFSLEDIQNDKKHFTTTVNFKKGEEVEIIAG